MFLAFLGFCSFVSLGPLSTRMDVLGSKQKPVLLSLVIQCFVEQSVVCGIHFYGVDWYSVSIGSEAMTEKNSVLESLTSMSWAFHSHCDRLLDGCGTRFAVGNIDQRCI